MIIIPILLSSCYLILYWISGIIDPGLMKRNYDCYGASELPLKIIHKGIYKTTKICSTCNIVRPFRASHCKDCDNCILRLDHHCPWLGGCIGKRNYIFFYFYLLFLNLNNFFILVISTLAIYDKFNSSKSFLNNKIILLHCLPSIFTIFYLLIIIFFTTGLFYNHTIFVFNNITTREEIKKLVHSKIGNPYNRGICNNCMDFFCRRKKDPKLNILKQLQKKEKIIKKKAIILKPKVRRRKTNKLLQEGNKFDNKNSYDRNRFYSIDERNINKIKNINNQNNNIRMRTYSLAVGNKKLYHAMKNLTLSNIECNNLSFNDDNNDNNTDFNRNLLNDNNFKNIINTDL